MKKSILTLAAIALISLGGFSQSGKLKRADNYYKKIAYDMAADIYVELLGSEVDSPSLKAKLANCYYQMGETNKAVEYYAQVVETPEAKPEDILNYAQSLKENGEYAKSDEWMKKFTGEQAADLRASAFKKNENYLAQIDAQGIRFEIKNLDVNTKFMDFGGYPMGDKKATFVTNRRNRLLIKRKYSWSGKKFLDVYEADVNANQQLVNESFKSRKINKGYHEGPMAFTSDLKHVYLTRNNKKKFFKKKGEDGIHNLKLYIAEVTEDGKWIKEKELPFNSKEYSVGHPTLSADGKTLYFASNMPGGFGGSDLYKVAINEDGSYGKPENMGEAFNTEGQEMFPWINKEGFFFFSSDGQTGLGGLDVFVMLADKNGNFKKLLNVGKPVNSSKDDFAFTMNNDGRTGYFSSNRDGGKGDDDIYGYVMTNPFTFGLTLKGLVTDKRSNDILPGASIKLIDADGNEVASTTANEKGEYEFPVDIDSKYTLEVTKDKYFDDGGSVNTADVAEGVTEIQKDLDLEKDPGIALYTLIMDSKTTEPIEGVKMIITDNMTGKEFINTVTPGSGDALKGLAGKKIGERVSYNITLEKEGYFPKTVTFNHKIDKPGVINVHDYLKGGLSLDKEVSDLAEMVELNPINFDLNKYKIRPDAEVELNKIIEVMNKYPNMEVELGSHTDCRASERYNRKLSDKRAKASAAYIKSKISNPTRIYGKGYGESRLLNDCYCEGKVKSTCTEEEHERNRRTEFRVISIGKDGVGVKNNSTDSFDNN